MCRLLAILLALSALLTTGCGAGGTGSGAAGRDRSGPVPPAGNATAGKRTFEDAGCSGCHTLAAADAGGKVGPNLDDSEVTYRHAFQQVRGGGGGMPSFGDRLSTREIANVAEFVVSERRG
jgi:mono/diheme cytochrome c family protein